MRRGDAAEEFARTLRCAKECGAAVRCRGRIELGVACGEFDRDLVARAREFERERARRDGAPTFDEERVRREAAVAVVQQHIARRRVRGRARVAFRCEEFARDVRYARAMAEADEARVRP
jgi:hypothetical protein